MTFIPLLFHAWARILYCYLLINIHLLDSWKVKNAMQSLKKKTKTIMYLSSERLSSSRIIFLAVDYQYFHFIEMIDDSACASRARKTRESEARSAGIKTIWNGKIWGIYQARCTYKIHESITKRVGSSRKNGRMGESDIYISVCPFFLEITDITKIAINLERIFLNLWTFMSFHKFAQINISFSEFECIINS